MVEINGPFRVVPAVNCQRHGRGKFISCERGTNRAPACASSDTLSGLLIHASLFPPPCNQASMRLYEELCKFVKKDFDRRKGRG